MSITMKICIFFFCIRQCFVNLCSSYSQNTWWRFICLIWNFGSVWDDNIVSWICVTSYSCWNLKQISIHYFKCLEKMKERRKKKSLKHGLSLSTLFAEQNHHGTLVASKQCLCSFDWSEECLSVLPAAWKDLTIIHLHYVMVPMEGQFATYWG